MATDKGLAQYEETMLAEISPLEMISKELKAEAEAQAITSDADLVSANSIKKAVNAHTKKVKDMRLDLTRPIDGLKETLITREREILAPAEEAKRIIGEGILAYEEEQARIRQVEEDRVTAITDRIRGLYKAGMTRSQVEAGRKAAKDLIAELDADGNLPRVKMALIDLSQDFTSRMQDIEIDEQRANKQKLDQKQAAIDAENRRQAAEKARQEAEAAQQEANKAAAKLERERPKSNIVEVVDFEITHPELVDPSLCSPDPVKIRAYIKAHPEQEFVPGIVIKRSKKVR